MRPFSKRPIGICDSGIGGLSVLLEVRRVLPFENLLYFADSRYAPYGAKSEEAIVERSVTVAQALLERDAKALVVACNTATAAAAQTLRSRFPIPIIGMEPGVKPAATMSISGVVGVLGTARTLKSEKYSRLVGQHGKDVRVISQACPGLVERIEALDFFGIETRRLVEAYVRPLVDQGADTLVLGCTHYPLIRPLIQEVAGRNVNVVDTGAAVAQEVRRRLDIAGLRAEGPAPGDSEFLTSGAPEALQHALDAIVGDGGDEVRIAL